MINSIKSYCEKVNEFMEAGDQPLAQGIAPARGVVTLPVLMNRIAMLKEEVVELKDALDDEDKVGIADAVADILYVAAGGYLELGVTDLGDITEYSSGDIPAVTARGYDEICNCVDNVLYDLEKSLEFITADVSALTLEFIDACVNLVEVVDFRFGLPIQELFDEVHSSNMTKVVDGKLIKSEGGKVLKPEGYRRPDLVPILEKYDLL